MVASTGNVPFAAGSLGSHRQTDEDDDQLIVSLRDKNADIQNGAPQSNVQALQEYLMVLAPQRLHYEIQMASGWDAGFPPEELVGLMQTSSGKGWHTPRFCQYPQDLVLRFSCGRCRIRKIQILSHHYKIASKLDFWMGSRKGVQDVNIGQVSGPYPNEDKFGDQYASDGENYYNEDGEIDLMPREEVPKRLPVLQFQKLGSISFDSNAGSNYSGRELKSINFDVEGEYLRVVIRQCHFEIVNGPGHGVSEVSMIPPMIPHPEVSSDANNISEAVRSLSIAEIKDHPSIYLDHDVQSLVAGFVKAKLDAAKVEDFSSAKLFKSGYESILKFADEIQELDIEKQQAVDNDDFDLAQELKAKVTAAKSRLMHQVEDLGFYTTLDGDHTIVTLTPRHRGKSPHEKDAFTTPKSANFSKSPSENRPSRLQQPQSYSPLSKTSPKPYHHSVTLQTLREGAFDQLSHSSFGYEGDHPDELTELERKNFSICLEVFANKVVACLVSRELQVRLYALDYVKEYLENEYDADDHEHRVDRTLLARAVFQTISVGLTDTREKVVSMALALLDQVVKFCLQNEIPHSTAYHSLEPIFSLLLVKASDLNTRVSQATLNRIVMLCNCFRTHPYSILPLVFRPARGTVMYRQSQSRIEVVSRLVNEYGVYDRAAGKGTPGGLDFENITEFAIPYLSHTNGEVRVAARKLIIDVCKFLNKTRVEQFLPGVKPLIIESIQKELQPKLPAPSVISPALSRTSAANGIIDENRSRPSSASSSTTKRRQIPTPLGVNLHMDSLKSLLVQPDSPSLAKTSRPSQRLRSETALAHQARIKMPLRSSIKATQALYSGVSRTAVKKQSALSPDEGNESTGSEGSKSVVPPPPPMVRRTIVQPQTRPKSGIVKSKSSKQDLSAMNSSGHLSGNDSQKASDTSSRSIKDRFCVFCDEKSSAFTDEGLVAHYWSDCAMLANCPNCKIIIEVPTLGDHMLKECSKRKFVKECETCQEIMAADAFLPHVAAGACKTISESAVRCPLCQIILPKSDEASWKRHLMQGGGCPGNKKGAVSQRPESHGSKPSFIPVVDTTTGRGYTTNITLSPTSPMSSSSSSSIRMESSVRPKGSQISTTVSPASSTTSSVLERSMHYKSATLPPTLASNTSSGVQRAMSHDYFQLQHQESVHPLDPVPAMDLAHSTSSGNLSAQHGGSANVSRIPKLGNFRSTSTNSGEFFICLVATLGVFCVSQEKLI
ncbi:hypothetical protein BGZ93_000117 [Podila epicladia]|nr:hypothetical protein BGZ93_000117 [Podila epicladia]